MPPGSEKGREEAGLQDQDTELFNIKLSDLLHIWQPDASTAQKQTSWVLK